MASLGEVVVSITANINEFRSRMQEAQGELRAFGDNARGVTDNFMTVGTYAAAAGGAMAAGLGLAVKTAADFESAMSRVGALSGASAKDMANLTETAKELGATTSFSASQAAEGMQFLAMAGYKTNEIIDAMPGLLATAAAGQVDLGTAADITSNILSGFGLAANETNRVADILTKTFTSSNTSLEMLGLTMKYVAPVASGAGISLEEVAAAAGILGNAGIQADQAGTTLRTTILQLIDPPKSAAEAMAALGLEVTDAKGNMLPLADIIEQIKQKTEGMTDAQKTAIAAQIVGKEAASGFISLIKAGPDALREYTQELENAGGTAERIAGKQLDNLNGALDQLLSSFEGVQISVGTALIPAIRTAAQFLNKISDRFNALPEPVKSSIAVFAAVTAGVLLLAGGLGIIIGLVPVVITGFSALAGVLATITGPIAAVVAGIIAAGIAIIANWDQIKAATQTMWDSIVQIWKSASEAIVVNAGNLKEFLQNCWVGIQEGVQNLWATFKDIFEQGWNAVAGFVETGWSKVDKIFGAYIGSIKTVINTFWAVLQTIFDAGFLAVVGIVTGDWDLIKRAFESAADIIEDTIQTMWDVLKKLWAEAFKQVSQNTQDTLNTIKNLFTQGFNYLKNLWTDSWNSIKTFFVNTWNSLLSVFRKAPGQVDSAMASIASNVSSTFRNMASNAYQMGRDIIRGLINGIGSLASALASRVRSVVSGAIDSAKRSLGISSPSKVFKEIGINTVKGFVVGMDKTIGTAVKAASDMVDGVTSVANGTSFSPGLYAVAGAGTGTATGGVNIHVGQLVVREDADINRIAEQLYRLQRRGQRAKGGF